MTLANMKAWRLHQFDAKPNKAIDSLRLEQVSKPKPERGEVRVRVRHTSVNPIDWRLFEGGTPAFEATLPYTPGFDISGEVDEVGDGVSFAPGDRVIAYLGLTETCSTPPPRTGSCGAFAEYVVVPQDRLALLPASADARVLAGLPLAGLTAYQVLFTGAGKPIVGEALGDLKAGQKLLVLGGSSGTGMFGVQLAKAAGAHVTATASKSAMPDGTPKIDFVRGLGADKVIDYRMQDWAEELAGQEYDMIFDCVGDNDDLVKATKVLKAGAPFLSIANFHPVVPESAKYRFAICLVLASGKDLTKLIELTEEGKLKVIVDSYYAFDKAQDALRKSISSKAAGKLIIDIQ